jgi:hypothetical protein
MPDGSAPVYMNGSSECHSTFFFSIIIMLCIFVSAPGYFFIWQQIKIQFYLHNINQFNYNFSNIKGR